MGITKGSFQKIYTQAKNYSNDIDDNKPMDPMVRLDNDGNWMIESSMCSAEDVSAECTLESFDDYFYAGYSDDSYTPTDTDVADFVKMFTENMRSEIRENFYCEQ